MMTDQNKCFGGKKSPWSMSTLKKKKKKDKARQDGQRKLFEKVTPEQKCKPE